MVKDGTGGDKTKTGLIFEQKSDLVELIKDTDFFNIKEEEANFNVLRKEGNDSPVAFITKKHSFYSFLKRLGINWKERISKQLLPDYALINETENTVYIIEVKYQQVSGSTDEKLQTCDFKKAEYERLFKGTKYSVEFIYILNDWFKNKGYKDVLEYIESVSCLYYFNEIPLEVLGLDF